MQEWVYEPPYYDTYFKTPGDFSYEFSANHLFAGLIMQLVGKASGHDRLRV
jgi:hypothetical protein